MEERIRPFDFIVDRDKDSIFAYVREGIYPYTIIKYKHKVPISKWKQRNIEHMIYISGSIDLTHWVKIGEL